MTLGAPSPTAITRTGDTGVEIAWSDGDRRRYMNRKLRDACPCATCREKRSAPPPPATELLVLLESDLQPLRIQGMKPLGAYAYSIDFSDGHNTGIYTFELLKSIGESVASA
ncbi:MAG: DUF971 domain-containing protein [Planctomycetes bacterium]|nr:DUF971 domain-containing protein [Planctomycetota bacterium]